MNRALRLRGFARCCVCCITSSVDGLDGGGVPLSDRVLVRVSLNALRVTSEASSVRLALMVSICVIGVVNR